MSPKDSLTPRDIELLLVALKSTKTELVIDYDKFAEGAGLKKSSAKSMWSVLKKKLEAARRGGDGAVSPAKGGDGTPTSSSAKGKKRTAAFKARHDDEETMSTPSSKKKRGPETASPAKDESGGQTKHDSPVKCEPEE